jgi:ABC-2 type transport system permease protein
MLQYPPLTVNRGRRHSAIWPVAWAAVVLSMRRRLSWLLYGLSLLVFLMFFFGQYLLSWAQGQTTETTIRIGFIRTDPARLIGVLRDALHMNGGAQTYRNFVTLQGSMVVIVLALAGSVLIGNDFRFGSLAFYLAKPLARWHYLAGKGLAVALLVNLMTTLPAMVLFVQYGFLDSWGYFVRGGQTFGTLSIGSVRIPLQGPNPLFFGILGYGALLTVCLSIMLLATSCWLRKTVPLIMVWTTVFFFFRLVAVALVDGLQYNARWRLLDLWNDMTLVGGTCLGLGNESFRSPRQPGAAEALFVLSAVCVACLIYLSRQIRAVEVVR